VHIFLIILILCATYRFSLEQRNAEMNVMQKYINSIEINSNLHKYGKNKKRIMQA